MARNGVILLLCGCCCITEVKSDRESNTRNSENIRNNGSSWMVRTFISSGALLVLSILSCEACVALICPSLSPLCASV